MNLYTAINRRKSCRKYQAEDLSSQKLTEIMAALKSFEPLHPAAPLNFRLTQETKGLFHVKAPHYLIMSGQGVKGEEENAGFIGQRLMLWLNSHELGGVWLGASKDSSQAQSSSDIIVLAFGKPEGSPHRTKAEFKRKNITAITNNPEHECILAAHLAPSGLNLQPWYFEKIDDRLLVYRQLLKPPLSLAVSGRIGTVHFGS